MMHARRLFALCAFLGVPAAAQQQYTFTHWVGPLGGGSILDGPVASAQFLGGGLLLDPAGSFLYFYDSAQWRARPRRRNFRAAACCWLGRVGPFIFMPGPGCRAKPPPRGKPPRGPASR